MPPRSMPSAAKSAVAPRTSPIEPTGPRASALRDRTSSTIPAATLVPCRSPVSSSADCRLEALRVGGRREHEQALPVGPGQVDGAAQGADSEERVDGQRVGLQRAARGEPGVTVPVEGAADVAAFGVGDDQQARRRARRASTRSSAQKPDAPKRSKNATCGLTAGTRPAAASMTRKPKLARAVGGVVQSPRLQHRALRVNADAQVATRGDRVGKSLAERKHPVSAHFASLAARSRS